MRAALAITCALAACGSTHPLEADAPSGDSPSGPKDITSFAFLKADNPGLVADITATVTSDQISATLPIGTEKTTLVATFTTSGASVAVGGVTQTSHVTPNDFSRVVTYTVIASDGSKKRFVAFVPVSGFGAPSNPVPFNSPTAVAVADFNGDGVPDIAFGTASGSVLVLLNTTAPGAVVPTFAPAASFPVSANVNAIAIADFNGDGKPDLAVTDPGQRKVFVLLDTTPTNGSTATFAAPAPFVLAAAGSFSPSSVAVGDLNGDGKPDIAVTDGTTNSLATVINTTATNATTPTFAAASALTLPTGVGGTTTATSSVIVDLNEDGLADLAVGCAVGGNTHDGLIALVPNTTAALATTATFGTAVTIDSFPNPSSIAAADFNGDGKKDLVWGHADGASLVLVTSVSPAISFNANGVRAGLAQGTVAVGDFNGDGKPDFAFTGVLSQLGTLSIVVDTTADNATTPTFTPEVHTPINLTIGPLAAADFNGDGKLDVVVGSSFGTLVLLAQ